MKEVSRGLNPADVSGWGLCGWWVWGRRLGSAALRDDDDDDEDGDGCSSGEGRG